MAASLSSISASEQRRPCCIALLGLNRLNTLLLSRLDSTLASDPGSAAAAVSAAEASNSAR
jgi:hypothetical protein